MKWTSITTYEDLKGNELTKRHVQQGVYNIIKKIKTTVINENSGTIKYRNICERSKQLRLTL